MDMVSLTFCGASLRERKKEKWKTKNGDQRPAAFFPFSFFTFPSRGNTRRGLRPKVPSYRTAAGDVVLHRD
jgi:hypothetical protein